jgi:hypothetical protein
MPTYIARFVRRGGESGTLCVMSSTPLAALLHLVQRHGPLRLLSLDPCKRPALTSSWSGRTGELLAGSRWPAGWAAGRNRLSRAGASLARALPAR